MCRTVPLPDGLVALVDDEDYDRVMERGPWGFKHKEDTRRTRHASRGGVTMHNFITGWPQTDHVNGDGLDNRRGNLRPAVGNQNQHNVKLRRDNTSGFKGVGRRRGKWHARIKVDGRLRFLGDYSDPIEAALAYDRAAREVAGEFACLNFPGPGEQGVK